MRNLLEAERTPLLQYGCEEICLQQLAGRFIQLAEDEATRRFREQGQSRNWLSDLASELAAALLQVCLTASDANVLLHLGQMFVLSTAQARILLDRARGSSLPTHGRRLLDCGAGDGSVTAQLEPLVHAVCCTEISHSAAVRLRQRGWECRVEEMPCFPADTTPFDLVSCLNVLCRASRPLSLLRRLRSLLSPDGLMIIAIVLPFEPLVLGRNRSSAPPVEHFPRALLRATSFEEGVRAFAELVLGPLGLTVAVVTRVPYYCQGTHGTYYVLDDAVFVVRISPPTAQ